MKTISKMYQVTFSDGVESNRRFDEVGKFESFESAEQAAHKHLRGRYADGIHCINQVPDPDYTESADWYVDVGEGKPKAIVQINCLPLTMISKSSSKPPYDSSSHALVNEIARQAVEGV